MNEIVKENLTVEDLIYEVRGKQVMLDSDLARLYEVETKRINEAVKNNPEKFPERYSWKLSIDETVNISRSKFSTLKTKQGTNIKYGARVFTEQGVYMLATILKSKIATEVSIRIMDAFVAMRHYLSNNLLEQKYINNLVLEDHDKINKLEITLDKMQEKKVLNEIYYNGQIYDAYSKILDILNSAKKSLIIIDAYADKTLLDIIRNLKIKIVLIVKTKSLLSKQTIEKYNKQYNNLKVIYNDTFHDRYFIIDNKIIYHCGTSLNYIGKKTFSINLLSDETIKNSLINNINNIIN